MPKPLFFWRRRLRHALSSESGKMGRTSFTRPGTYANISQTCKYYYIGGLLTCTCPGTHGLLRTDHKFSAHKRLVPRLGRRSICLLGGAEQALPAAFR